jgi:hypothetical protein
MPPTTTTVFTVLLSPQPVGAGAGMALGAGTELGAGLGAGADTVGSIGAGSDADGLSPRNML